MGGEPNADLTTVAVLPHGTAGFFERRMSAHHRRLGLHRRLLRQRLRRLRRHPIHE